MIVILLTRNTTGLAKWLSVPLRTMVVGSDPVAATNVNVFKVTVFRQFLCFNLERTVNSILPLKEPYAKCHPLIPISIFLAFRILLGP